MANSRKQYRLKLHVGIHDWLRYGDLYEGEPVPDRRRISRPRVRIFNPADDSQSAEVQASWLEEVQ